MTVIPVDFIGDQTLALTEARQLVLLHGEKAIAILTARLSAAILECNDRMAMQLDEVLQNVEYLLE